MSGAPDVSGGGTSEPRSFYAQPVWKRFYAFLLGPLLLAAAAVALFTTISILTRDNTTPEDLVSQLRSGGQHQKWQAAFALTKYLQPSPGDSKEAYEHKLLKIRLMLPDILDVFEAARRDDAQVRQYLALALGYLEDRMATPALTSALDDADAQTVLNSLVSLGLLADPAAIPKIIEVTRRDDGTQRSVATYVLGTFRDPSATARLEESVSDRLGPVRWNAAFGLARSGNALGEDVIAEILQRGELYQSVADEPEKQREQFLNAIQAAALVQSPRLVVALREIAEHDSDLKARDLAKKVLQAAPVRQ